MTIRQFITDSKGNTIRGAITRIAEFQGVSVTQVQRWMHMEKTGVGLPISRARMVQDMIHAKIPLFCKSPHWRKNLSVKRKKVFTTV